MSAPIPIWFGWLTEYPDEGSAIVMAKDAKEAEARTRHCLSAEPEEDISVKPVTASDVEMLRGKQCSSFHVDDPKDAGPMTPEERESVLALLEEMKAEGLRRMHIINGYGIPAVMRTRVAWWDLLFCFFLGHSCVDSEPVGYCNNCWRRVK